MGESSGRPPAHGASSLALRGPQRLTSDKLHVTFYSVIRSFRHKGLQRLYEHDDGSRIRPDLRDTIRDTIEDILGRLDRAEMPQALNLPGYRLHPLKGDLKGFWSVTVRANWRIIFRFQGTDAFDVELTDYH